MHHHKLLLFFVLLYNCLNFSKALFGNNIRTVREGEFPSVVCIMQGQLTDSIYREYVVCTGAFISNQHIVTAAHCLNSISLASRLVVYGTIDIRYGERLGIQWWITFDQWAALINLDTQPTLNDISVIKLYGAAPNHITPADICPVATNRLYGLNAAIVGCGGESNPPEFPTNFETVELKIISKRECERRSNDILGYYGRLDDKALCSVAEPFALMSRGDSGGPLLRRNYILGVNIGPYPNINTLPNRNYVHSDSVNYHVSVDCFRHFLEDIMSM